MNRDGYVSGAMVEKTRAGPRSRQERQNEYAPITRWWIPIMVTHKIIRIFGLSGGNYNARLAGRSIVSSTTRPFA